eukprot:3794521-Pyramimonas_sp.AAC.1
MRLRPRGEALGHRRHEERVGVEVLVEHGAVPEDAHRGLHLLLRGAHLLTADQSDAGNAGIFSRRTNQTQEARRRSGWLLRGAHLVRHQLLREGHLPQLHRREGERAVRGRQAEAHNGVLRVVRLSPIMPP